MPPVEGDPWDASPPRDEAEALIVDVDGFEGPLDLLLSLARTQKVDLTRISVLALAEQYIAYVEEARRLRLELAADYLVMAAWLAYLKSKLLLPKQEEEEPSGEEMAAHLAFRLRRLEAMREAAARLVNRDRLGRDVFPRGDPEGMRVERRSRYEASLYDLLSAYGARRSQNAASRVVLHRRRVVGLQEAREILTRLIGDLAVWTPLDVLMAAFPSDDARRSTSLASAFSASLELCREGRLDLRQERPFAPLYLRARDGAGA
ncbi:segregation and condensation protein A [Lutibaculum baratangense]|uniref:Segregation and condensation protein A n=1 Tax=Lutibaculum baratangense AMV1 TaxID=631454 RepID=V4QUX0_9HYPH|nr:ScpA family protein [Lutibaculum baratangense]ESR23542.1 Segregation and condensation protein A [Lutibaculum baratangense AMV1]